jgi:hypothetical protein
MNKYNPLPSLYRIEMPLTYGGTITKLWQDFGMGMRTLDKPSLKFVMMDESGKLRRESGDNDAEVRKLGGPGVDYAPYIFQEQLKTNQMKIEYRVEPYNCIKFGKVDDTTNPYDIIKIIVSVW